MNSVNRNGECETICVVNSRVSMTYSTSAAGRSISASILLVTLEQHSFLLVERARLRDLVLTDYLDQSDVEEDQRDWSQDVKYFLRM